MSPSSSSSLSAGTSAIGRAGARLKNVLQQVAGSPNSNGILDPSYVAHAQLLPTLFLPKAAAIEKNAPAIVHTTIDGQPVKRTYGEFADRACALAYYLKKHSYSRVGILCPNTPAFLETIFAVGASGGAHVGINYRLHKSDVQYILEHAECDLIIIDREFVSLLEGFKDSVPVIIDEDTLSSSNQFNAAVTEGFEYDKTTGGHGWNNLNKNISENDLLAIPYTSGTTAKPKGVMYTHRGAWMAAIANIAEAGLNSQHALGHSRCRYLWTLPLFHATGWTYPWAVTAARGTHYCLRKIDYDIIWNLLHNEKISHACFAPTVGTLLCASPSAKRLDQEVRVSVAASPPTPSLFKNMFSLNLVPVHVYGLTETYGPITRNYFMQDWNQLSEYQKYERMARQGHGFLTSDPCRVIKPDQPEGVIEDVKMDGIEIGEIVFTGNVCGQGYYKNPEATRKLFAGGVLHSGDLALWYPDGAVHILDRAKDIIISGGENISSVALESSLSKHPEILEVGVIGVPHTKWGEVCKAFITTRNGATVSPDKVIAWAKNESDISRFMVPAYVEIVEELPKTSTGKIKKTVLREWHKSGRAKL